MKQWTKQINKRFEQVAPDGVNANTDQWIETYNGGLDSQNLPVNLIENTKLVTTTSNTSSTNCTKYEWIGQTQSYYAVRHTAAEEGGINEWLATADVNLITDSWNIGWNNLSEYISDAYMNVELVEGIISGNFNINWFYGIQTYASGGGGSSTWGYDWWIRWGLFMNGELIAETGNCYPRQENTCVPFKLPVGSQSARFELKWQALTSNPDPATMSVPSDQIISLIQLYGFNIWINNTYK